jgi:hypothetical protein
MGRRAGILVWQDKERQHTGNGLGEGEMEHFLALEALGTLWS